MRVTLIDWRQTANARISVEALAHSEYNLNKFMWRGKMLIMITLMLVIPSELTGQAIIPISKKDVAPEFFKVAGDGLLFQAVIDEKVTEINFNGEIQRFYPAEPGKSVGTFGYLHDLEMIVLLQIEGESKASLLIYDRLEQNSDNPDLGEISNKDYPLYRGYPGYLLTEDGLEFQDPYFLQFFTSNDRYFINLSGNRDLKTDAPLIYEANFFPYRDGFAIQIDRGFDRITEFEPVPDLDLRWVVAIGQDIWVVNQQQIIIKKFKPDLTGKRPAFSEAVDERIRFNLPNWQIADSKKHSDQFSKNVGFFPVGNKYIHAYTFPNRNNENAKVDSTQSESPDFVLRLREITEDGEFTGKQCDVPGSHIIGVSKNRAVLLCPVGEKYQISLFHF